MRTWMCRLVVAGLLAATFSGCDRSPAGNPAGAVAVIDLDAVAKELGRDKVMAQSVQEQLAALNEQLATIQVSYEKELSDRRARLGDNPPPEEVQRLSDAMSQVAVNRERIQAEAKQKLAQYRAKLIRTFRDEVRPVARQVAAEKGLSVIITKNDHVVFDFAAASDITDEVTSRLRSKQ